MECESYNLEWAEFNSYTSKTFRELLASQDFTDVTLVCDDDAEGLRAHKVILSACSPFFNRILKKSDHNHPLVYLSDVNLNELKAIVNFMYLGQTNVEQQHLQKFLKVAGKLQVRGLTENKKDEDGETNAHRSYKKMSAGTQMKSSSPTQPVGPVMNTINFNESVEEHQTQVKTELSSAGYYYENNLNSQEELEERVRPGVQGLGEDNKYPCDQCDYKATYACNLASHKRTVHEGVYYTCTICSYKSSRKDRLNKHYMNKHGTTL